MSCEIIQELLSSYLEGEAGSEEKKLVAGHLRTCQSCSNLFSLLKEARRSLADFPEVDVSGGLLSKLYAIPEKRKKVKLSLEFLLRPSLQPVLAIATVFFVMISFYIFNPEKKFINKSISRQLHLGYSQVEKLYAKAGSLTDNLGKYKEDILVSIKNSKLLTRNGD